MEKDEEREPWGVTGASGRQTCLFRTQELRLEQLEPELSRSQPKPFHNW
jgi:hypothetical protein